MGASGLEASGQPVEARALRWAALAAVLLALLPSLWTLDAPWIAEDADILARVAADGPWADWTRPQYGLRLLRFWRPLVSTSWSVQETLTGIAPLPLRALNLLLHAAAAGLAVACAARLGAGVLGAFLAGAWIALFPEQGGTITWLAGRTDGLCAALLLAALWTALGPRGAASAPLAFLACAAKEFGFLAPLWITLCARARGETWTGGLRRAVPALLGATVAFVWRWVALGGLAGGYAAALPSPFAGLAGSLAALVKGASWTLVGALLLGAAGRLEGRALRTSTWPLVAALAALALLYPLLADGLIEPQNCRLFFVPECALALALALAWGRSTAKWATPGLGVAALVLLSRALLAWGDTHEWEAAALAGEEQVARTRLALVGAEPADRPVLFEGFPVAHGGAYCLGFGVAARFRAPFHSAARLVWPWRLAFFPAAERERQPRVERRTGGGFWPLDDPPRVAELRVENADGDEALRLVLDRSVLLAPTDESPRLVVSLAEGPVGSGPVGNGSTFEALIASEIGYEPFLLGERRAFSLRELLECSNGVASVGQLLVQVADLGSRRVFLELRSLGPDGSLRAASPWIELAWGADLLEAALSAQ